VDVQKNNNYGRKEKRVGLCVNRDKIFHAENQHNHLCEICLFPIKTVVTITTACTSV